MTATEALFSAGEVVKNNGTGDFALARYEPDGGLDKTLGTNGKTTADADRLRLNDSARAIAVQPDGRLVVVGDVAIDREGPLDAFAWGLARFLP